MSCRPVTVQLHITHRSDTDQIRRAAVGLQGVQRLCKEYVSALSELLGTCFRTGLIHLFLSQVSVPDDMASPLGEAMEFHRAETTAPGDEEQGMMARSQAEKSESRGGVVERSEGLGQGLVRTVVREGGTHGGTVVRTVMREEGGGGGEGGDQGGGTEQGTVIVERVVVVEEGKEGERGSGQAAESSAAQQRNISRWAQDKHHARHHRDHEQRSYVDHEQLGDPGGILVPGEMQSPLGGDAGGVDHDGVPEGIESTDQETLIGDRAADGEQVFVEEEFIPAYRQKQGKNLPGYDLSIGTSSVTNVVGGVVGRGGASQAESVEIVEEEVFIPAPGDTSGGAGALDEDGATTTIVRGKEGEDHGGEDTTERTTRSHEDGATTTTTVVVMREEGGEGGEDGEQDHRGQDTTERTRHEEQRESKKTVSISSVVEHRRDSKDHEYEGYDEQRTDEQGDGHGEEHGEHGEGEHGEEWTPAQHEAWAKEEAEWGEHGAEEHVAEEHDENTTEQTRQTKEQEEGSKHDGDAEHEVAAQHHGDEEHGEGVPKKYIGGVEEERRGAQDDRSSSHEPGAVVIAAPVLPRSRSGLGHPAAHDGDEEHEEGHDEWHEEGHDEWHEEGEAHDLQRQLAELQRAHEELLEQHHHLEKEHEDLRHKDAELEREHEELRKQSLPQASSSDEEESGEEVSSSAEKVSSSAEKVSSSDEKVSSSGEKESSSDEKESSSGEKLSSSDVSKAFSIPVSSSDEKVSSSAEKASSSGAPSLRADRFSNSSAEERRQEALLAEDPTGALLRKDEAYLAQVEREAHWVSPIMEEDSGQGQPGAGRGYATFQGGPHEEATPFMLPSVPEQQPQQYEIPFIIDAHAHIVFLTSSTTLSTT